MFLVVSRLDEHFGFDHPFFVCPIGRASKITSPKSRAPRKKFVHSCKAFFFQRYILNRQTSNKELLAKTYWTFNGWVLRTPLYFEMYWISRSQMFFKIGIIKNFIIFTGRHLCWSPSCQQLYSKESPTEVFFSEYCGIFKNSYFYRTPLVDA